MYQTSLFNLYVFSVSPAIINEKSSPSKLEKLPSLNPNKGSAAKTKTKAASESASLADIPPLDGLVNTNNHSQSIDTLVVLFIHKL